MDRAGLLDFDIEEFYPTPENHQECMVVLTPKKSPRINYDKYKKLLATISPFVDSIEARINRSTVTNLEETVAGLRIENGTMKRELEAILGSKKWRYSKKIADLKDKIIRNGKVDR